MATAVRTSARAAAQPARLVTVLEERAASTPDGVAYEFIDGEGLVERLTYAELHAQASRLAQAIVARCDEAEPRPVVLLYPPGLGYVTAVYACFLARAPAVPAYPPEPWRPDLGLSRLRGILEQASRPVVLADEQVTAGLRELAGLESGDALLVPRDDDREPVTLPRPTSDDVALVQYTSGSTAVPRGAVVRHRNLEHNIAAIAALFRLDHESRGFIWLPPYHDMGLIGGILTPLVYGFPVRLMSPLDFLKRPLVWLQQVSEMRATVTGGPNFAYDLCVRRRVEDEWLETLDLSCWLLAFNGAEPVRWQTLADFAQKFGPAGFRSSAFFPCYGLAEATLIVSGRHWDGTILHGRERVDLGLALKARAAGEPLRISCGPPLPDEELVVIDPASGRPRAEGEEGELWLRGPSVVDGYWEPGAAEDGLFAELDGRRFLRTGDIGYLVAGELVPTGRLKDVVVHRGRNYHAADLEGAAVAFASELRPAAAAFALDDGDEERVVLVVEARPGSPAPDELAVRVRESVLAATGVPVDSVVVAPPRTIPKTSSGKVQRSLCRDRFRAGDYDAFVVDALRTATPETAAAAAPAVEGVLAGVAAGVFAAVCAIEACGRDQTLYEIGGDSLRAAEAAAILERAFNLPVPVEAVLETLTPNELARALLARWRRLGIEPSDLRELLAQERRR